MVRYFDHSTNRYLDTPTHKRCLMRLHGTPLSYSILLSLLLILPFTPKRSPTLPKFGQTCRPALCPLKREMRNQESSFTESLLDALNDVSLLASDGQVVTLQERFQGGHGEALELPDKAAIHWSIRQGRGGRGIEGGGCTHVTPPPK